METKAALQLFVALLAIMNPLTVVPIFLALTEGYTVAARRKVIVTATFAMFVTLAVVLVTGTRLLDIFGITINDFRVAGGVLIFIMALALLRATPSRMRHVPEEAADGKSHDNPAFYPLAIPMMAGPGSMTTVIVFGQKTTSGTGLAIAVGVIAVVGLLIAVTLLLANWLAREVGVTGMNIVTRLMGLILAAIAVSMIFEGIRGAFPMLAGG
ncbi:MAG: NAAT family transporter [Alphaproteobacteria bacterium]|nr:NAAT family transporter [Alphaproteobacteria bacterium]